MELQAIPILEGGSTFQIGKELSSKRFVDLLDQHKALIFQSTGEPLSTEDFGHFVTSLELQYYPYVGGAAPRTIIPVAAGKDIVFTANESPPDQPIPFHHELAQTKNPPEYVFFYCDTPTQVGGETPLIDSTLVYRYVKENHPEFLSKVEEHGARYIRTVPSVDDPSSPIGRSYKSTWNVSSRQELDERLSNEEDCSWEWIGDGDDACVRVTTAAVPGLRLVKDHVQNQIFQYTFANSIVAAYLGWEDSRNNRFEALRYGNMEKMPSEVLEDIATFMEDNRVLYKWKSGDIMAVNNQLVMHSRNPFSGKRRVFASLWGPPKRHVSHAEPECGKAVGLRSTTFYEPLEPADPLVFGFWKVPREVAADVCYRAIATGYRRLDCACDYGNEREVGVGIAKALNDGLCKREDLFVTSKLWNTYHHPEHVPMALARTLKDLQLTYLDEYLIHFPISMEFVPFEDKYPPEWTNLDEKMVIVPNDMMSTWKAMEALVDQSLCKTIGVCNFSIQLLRQLLSTCRIRPSTLQVELHPHNTQENLVRFAREAGMRVTGFSVLGATSYLELDMATRNDVLFEDDTICALAEIKQKSPAQILIRWALQRNTLPITKTSNENRMDENRGVFDFYLTPVEMEKIDGLNKNRRYNDPGVFCQLAFGTFCPIYD